jgi:predicted ribosomally synthesized peptide with SipW-like signal peptide
MVASALGVALLFTGSTLALWYDSEDIQGGRIWSGNLDLAVDSKIWDVSRGASKVDVDDWTENDQYRKDQDPTASGRSWGTSYPNTAAENLSTEYASCGFNANVPAQPPQPGIGFPGSPAVPSLPDPVLGHTIGEPWNAVPGDRVLAIYPIEIALDGDNMVAELWLDHGDAELDFEEDWIDLEAVMYSKDRLGQPTGRHIPLDTLFDPDQDREWLGTFQADNQADGLLEEPTWIQVITKKEIDPAAFDPRSCLVIRGSFDVDTKGQDAIRAANGVDRLELLKFMGSLKITLEQIRDPGNGHFR